MGRHKHSLDCLKLSPRGSVLSCSVTGTRGDAGDSPYRRNHPGEELWKKPTGKACRHGFKIFLVNGAFIRNNYDSDFVQGGNGERYRFCPRDELWLDESMPKEERPYVLKHECEETEKMRLARQSSKSKGRLMEIYERGHIQAKRIENKMRRARHPGE